MIDVPSVVIPREWDRVDRVLLAEVARCAHVDPASLHMATARGLIHPLPRTGRSAFLSPEDARAVLMAAALAVAAGIALATALRVVAAGATFPLPVAVAA